MSRALPALIAVLFFAPPVLAQSGSSGDKAPTTFDEIERGFYLGVGGGPFFIVNPPATSGPRPFSPGQMAQVELGLDLFENLSVGGFLMGTMNRAGSDYTGTTGTASGDFAALVAGGVAKLSLFGIKDAQDVKRTWIYFRGGAGYTMFAPNNLLDRSDVLVFAGPGVEYFTRLRHFSVGVEITGSYLLTSGSFGFGVTPNLRYAF